MPNIRPVSDLRNHFAEITKEVQLSGEPIFLTKNGVGSIVVMSMESYEQNRYDSMVYDKLRITYRNKDPLSLLQVKHGRSPPQEADKAASDRWNS